MLVKMVILKMITFIFIWGSATNYETLSLGLGLYGFVIIMPYTMLLSYISKFDNFRHLNFDILFNGIKNSSGHKPVNSNGSNSMIDVVNKL